MRLLKLEVENLNALYGAHAIDFRGDLQEAPLFLIHGPTGSGKSTLLDAISLALFGVTPRLPDRGPREAKEDVAPSQILSRGTALGRAVLTFAKSTAEGPVTYRATWKVWRGNVRAPKPEGKVQGPYRWLDRLESATGEWVRMATDYTAEQGRARDLEAALTEALEGFSLPDFMRCMLLAQGDFAAFLKATEEERGKILERLTRTEQYQQIGARAAERWRQAGKVVEQLEAALGGLQILDEAALEALREDLAQAREALEGARQREEAARTGLTWLDQDLELSRMREAAQLRLAEAEAALAQAAPDLARLAAFEAAREALQALETATQARELARSLGEAEATRVREVAELEAQLEARTTEGKAASEALRGAQEAYQIQEPQLREAREARQARASAEAELERSEQIHGQATQAVDGARQAATDADFARVAADTVLSRARQALEAAPWEALAQALAGLEARQTALATARDSLTKDAQARQRLATELEGVGPILAQAQAAREALRPRQAGVVQEAEAAERERTLQLEGHPDAACARKHLEGGSATLRARGEALRDLQRQASALEGTRLEGLTQAHQEAHAAQVAAREAMAQASAALGAARSHQEAQARDLDLLRWARDLVQEREKLQAGCACPLCGSEAHPALEDPTQAARDAAVEARCVELEASLRGAVQALEEAEVAHRRAEAEAVRRDTECQGAARALEAATLEDREARARLDAAARALDTAWDTLALETALVELATQEGALQRRREILEQAETAHQKAQAALNETRLALQKAEGDLATAQERQRALTQRLADEDQRLTQAQAQVAALEAEAAAQVQAFGLPAGDPLPEARRRVKAWQAAGEALRKAEQAQAEATRESALKAQALEAALSMVTQAAQAVEARRTQLAAAQARCAAVLGGEDPEPLEAGLKQAVKAAEDRVTVLREAYAKAKAEAARAQGELDGTRRQRVEAEAALQAAEATLGALLPAFGTEADLASLALPADEVRRLEGLRQGCERTHLEAESALKAHVAQCEAHGAQRPDGLQASDREALQVARDAAQADIQAHQEAATRADLALQAQAQARDKQAEGLAQLEAARQELSRWTRLKDLIGTHEGEAFRRFAQVLNLRDLLAKANARLEKLRDRYRLVPAVGSEGERLAFAVEDAAHAGEVRPVGTLSGGETFLVSLSLALALADYRTVRMPIETLLLDEGFGTLDPATLADVLGTLGALTSQGTQVGIISHVEALKEKIPARIQVESLGAGRSRVVVG